MKKSPTIFKAGDRVAYSVRWLKSVCAMTGELPFLRGTVQTVQKFGGEGQLVTIAWDNYTVKSDYHDDGFGRVLNANLTLVERIAIDAALNT